MAVNQAFQPSAFQHSAFQAGEAKPAFQPNAFQDDAFQTYLEEVAEAVADVGVSYPSKKIIQISDLYFVLRENTDTVRIKTDQYNPLRVSITENADTFIGKAEAVKQIEIIEEEQYTEALLKITEIGDAFIGRADRIKEVGILNAELKAKEFPDIAGMRIEQIPFEAIKDIEDIKRLKLRKEEEEFLIMLLLAA